MEHLALCFIIAEKRRQMLRVSIIKLLSVFCLDAQRTGLMILPILRQNKHRGNEFLLFWKKH